MDTVNFQELKTLVEEQTGFKCYEGQPGDQQVWYGTTDKLDNFKSMVGTALPTGSVVYLMDTGLKTFWSKFKGTWY